MGRSDSGAEGRSQDRQVRPRRARRCAALGLLLALLPGCMTVGSYYDEGWWKRRHEFETGILYGAASFGIGGTIGASIAVANEKSADRNDKQTAALLGFLIGAPIVLAADLLIVWITGMEDAGRSETIGP